MTKLTSCSSILRFHLIVLLGVFGGLGNPLQAQTDVPVPHFIAHQGELTGADATYTGSGQFKFALVTRAAPITAYWKNDNNSLVNGGQTPVTEPVNAMTLNVVAGTYGVFLGYANTNNAWVPYSVFSKPGMRVRTWFRRGTTGAFVQQPDGDLPAVGYAMQIPDASVTTAKIAANAVTSAQLANGAVGPGKVGTASIGVANLLTSAAPAAGQVLSYNGTNLSWTIPGGAWSLNGTNAFYNAGNVGIGTNVPVHKLAVIGGPSWTSNFWTGSLELANASAIGWQANTAGQRFGIGHTNGGFCVFRTPSDPGTTASAAVYDLFIGDTGKVGIGTTTPAGQLDIYGAQDALRITGYGPVLTFRDTGNGSARSAIQAVAGDTNIFAESYLSGANGFAFLKLSNSGNVGIGSSQPVGKLEVVAQDALRLIGYQPFLTIYDDSNGYARGRIQSVAGALNLFTENYLNGSNTNAYAQLSNAGIFSVKALTIRGGADLAEPFQMKEEVLEKGAVVVIDVEHPGRLKRSGRAYDRRVAGIVSGANGVNPGIALHQEGVLEGGQNVALSGRVYVRADASGGAIEPGDLLTTSDRPGHAMKVTDYTRAQGAVIGKAMSSLDEGTGLVLVLVTLQ
jgi:hypothetical protein